MKTKLYFSILLLLLLLTAAFSQSPNWLWAKSIGGTGNEYGPSIAVDASGNVYTTGSFEGTVDFDPGVGTFNLTSVALEDIFISKLDNSGNFVWAKEMGGTGEDAGMSAVIDASGNVQLAGYFRSPTIAFGSTTLTNAGRGNYDAFVAKLDHITGIESVEHKNGFSVFPNPSKGEFTIEMNEMQNPSADGQHDISIYNVLGEKVYKAIINLNAPNGIYFLHIKTENNSVTQKLIIQK